MLVGIIIVLVTARMLGPHGQGVIAGATAWVGLIATMAGLSLGQVSQHVIQLKQRRDWLPNIFGTLLYLLGILSFLAFLFAGILYFITQGSFFGKIDPLVLTVAFCMLPMLIWDEYSSNLLASAGRLRTYNLMQVAGRTLWMVLIVILVVVLGLGVFGALIAQILGQLLVALASIYFLWVAAGRVIRVGRSEIRHILHGSLRLHINTIASFLLGQTSILVLNHYFSKADVGWYYLSWQMVTILSVIPQSVSIVLYAKMADVGPNGIWPAQKRLLLYTMALMLLLITISYLIGPRILITMVGTKYLPSTQYFRLLLPALLGITLAQIMAPQWIGRGLLLQTTVVTAVTAIANLGAQIILVPRYGIIGVVWSTIMSYTVIAVIVQLGFIFWCQQRYTASIHLRKDGVEIK